MLRGRWRPTPLKPALKRQRQVNFCEFEANLVYIVSFRPGLHTETLSRKIKIKINVMLNFPPREDRLNFFFLEVLGMEALSKHSTLSYIPSLCPVLSQPVYLPDRADVHLNTCVIAIG